MQQMLHKTSPTAYQWLLFCPNLPANPSSPRVTVWRRMRSAGAASLDNGLWLLPESDAAASLINEMQAYVTAQGGTSKTFRAQSFDPQTEEDILLRFQQDRAAEYTELQEQCAVFLAEIEKEMHRGKYSFAEFEENEADLLKLESWLAKIQQRDFQGGSLADTAAKLLEQCRQLLQLFSREVINRELP